MEKILLWGITPVYEVSSQWVKERISQNELEVLAIVDSVSDLAELDGYRVIRKEEISNYKYDKIIITAGNTVTRSILKEIQEIGLDPEKVIRFAEYEMQYVTCQKERYEKIIDGQINTIKSLLSASDQEVADYNWMLRMIYGYGIYPFAFGKLQDAVVTNFGLMQVPDEFARFCNYIGTLKVDTAIEVGVYRGRSSYFISALLSRKNPHLTYYMADIRDSLDSFEKFKKVLPALEKKIPSRSEDYAEKEFDFVFIDADHSYDASIKDYYNVGQYARKITCFHDIYAHEYDMYNGGMVRTWKEVQRLTSGKQHKIFSMYPDRWMGIGCVIQEQ